MRNHLSWFMWTPWFLEMKQAMFEGLWRAMKGYEGLWRAMKGYEVLWWFLEVLMLVCEGVLMYLFMMGCDGIWKTSRNMKGSPICPWFGARSLKIIWNKAICILPLLEHALSTIHSFFLPIILSTNLQEFLVCGLHLQCLFDKYLIYNLQFFWLFSLQSTT